MKLIYYLLPLLLTAVLSSPAQSQSGNNQWLLYEYLKAEGHSCHVYFTVEDFYVPNSGRSLLYVPIEYKDITSTDDLISYLRQQLPDAAVSVKYKGVVSIIKTSLLSDKNYAFNKSVSCNYDGTNYDLLTYLNPLVGNSLCITNQDLVFERVHLPINLSVSIHTKKEEIRSIFTAHLPLDHISTILWTAQTTNRSGKEITYVRVAGWDAE